MEFEVDFYRIEQAIQKLATEHNGKQIIKNITLHADCDMLWLSVFNDEILIETSIPVDMNYEGAATVSIDNILNALSNIYTDNIDTIKIEIISDKMRISNRAKTKKIKLLNLKYSEDTLDSPKPISLKIDRCYWDMFEKIPSAHDGVTLFEFSENMLTVAYANKQLLCVMKSEYITNDKISLMIPPMAIEKMQDLVGDRFDFEILVDEYHIMFVIEGIIFSFKKTTSVLDYRYMLSQEYNYQQTTISKKDIPLYIAEKHVKSIESAIDGDQVILDIPQRETDPLKIASVDGDVVFLAIRKKISY